MECLKGENRNKKEVGDEALQPQQFLKIKQPKEKSRLWGHDLLFALDFEQKKCSDFGSIDKKDARKDVGGEKHYPEGNYND